MFQKKSTYYLLFLLTIAVIAGVSYSPLSQFALDFVHHDPANAPLIFAFFEVSLLFLFGFYAFYLAKNIHIPSFVIAIFLGIAAKPFLETIIHTQSGNTLNALVAIGATLILFGGGIETPFKSFQKLCLKILLLSFPGLLITAILFSYTALGIGNSFGVTLSISAVVLLGAILSSTDPAAILPVLRVLRFRNKDTKDIVISESALTDVTGTLLTLAFLSIISIAVAEGIEYESISDYYAAIVSADTLLMLGKELFFGIFFGIVGYLMLNALVKFKHHHDEEFEVDSAFFLFVPLMIFAVTLAFHGSGYLAAFIVGLLFTVHHKIRHSEHFYNQVVEGYLKPMIFILLGALIDLPALLQYAGVGIAISLAFMFVIRPLSVFVSLGIFTLIKNRHHMSVRELLFISFVRETGAIPAVLLVTIQSQASNNPLLAQFLGNGILEIGMWVILMTLIVEPIMTPWVATRLGVAEVMKDEESIDLEEISQKSSTVLVTRGYTFLDRIDGVVEWSRKHGISSLIVLLCLENKYSEQAEKDVHHAAYTKFQELEKEHPSMQFHFTSRRGLLQDNITELSADQGNHIVAIFVGKKMLDYRLEEIKKLAIPFRFID